VNEMVTLIQEQQTTIITQQVEIEALKTFVGMGIHSPPPPTPLTPPPSSPPPTPPPSPPPPPPVPTGSLKLAIRGTLPLQDVSCSHYNIAPTCVGSSHPSDCSGVQALADVAQLSTDTTKWPTEYATSLAFNFSAESVWSSMYITVPDYWFNPSHTSDYTIEAWVKKNSYWDGGGDITDDDTHLFPIVAIGMASPNLYSMFGITKSGQAVVFGAGSYKFMSTGKVSAGEWHHLAFVNSGGDGQIYIDGVPDGTAQLTSTPSGIHWYFMGNRWAHLRIGGWHQSHGMFGGYINDVRIYENFAKYTTSFVPESQPFPVDATQC